MVALLATAFAKQFTSVVSHTSDPYTRIVRSKLHEECPLDSSIIHFSSDIVSKAIINSGNFRAAGPDDRSLKNLGFLRLRYLTPLYNLSINRRNIPAIWKHVIITPCS